MPPSGWSKGYPAGKTNCFDKYSHQIAFSSTLSEPMQWGAKCTLLPQHPEASAPRPSELIYKTFLQSAVSAGNSAPVLDEVHQPLHTWCSPRCLLLRCIASPTVLCITIRPCFASPGKNCSTYSIIIRELPLTFVQIALLQTSLKCTVHL